VIRFKVEVTGAKEAAEQLRALGRRAEVPEGAFLQAGFYLLLRIWDRITGKPVEGNYSAQYVAWLVRRGEYSGKMIGILAGALIAQSAPTGGSAGELGTTVGRDYVEVGFLNPSPKAHGFLGWFKRKFGHEAISADDRDQREIARIFDEWIAGAR
jgi:hypothetical protein